MKLSESFPKLKEISKIPFSELFTLDELKNIIIAKGNTGKLLEKLLSLPSGNTLRDFEDGELKTNKCDYDGKPLETMFISQISSRFDELLGDNKTFKDNWIYEKIKRLVYVPVVKATNEFNDWYFLDYIFVEINETSYLFKQLEADYNSIKKKIKIDLNKNDNFIHTSNGKLIQIRTKDAKPYNPIKSNILNREVSNKNFAFYFKKDFMKTINP